MNFIETLKTKAVKFESEHRIVPKLVSVSAAATTAMTCAAIGASAETASGSGNSVDISSVTDAMTSSLTDLVGKVAVGCAAVVGVGLTIFGIKWCVKTVKSFFSRIAG